MTKKEVVTQLQKFIDSVNRYEDSDKYIQLISHYIIFVAEENRYIPNAIDSLYKKGTIKAEILSEIDVLYKIYSTSQKDSQFLTGKDWAEEIYKFSISFLENNLKNSNSQIPIPISKEDFLFDIESFHNKLINELLNTSDEKLVFSELSFYLDDNKILTISTNSNERVLFESAYEIIKRERTSNVSYDEIGEYYYHGNPPKNLNEVMRQAARRVEKKLLSTGLFSQPPFKYDSYSITFIR